MNETVSFRATPETDLWLRRVAQRRRRSLPEVITAALTLAEGVLEAQDTLLPHAEMDIAVGRFLRQIAPKEEPK